MRNGSIAFPRIQVPSLAGKRPILSARTRDQWCCRAQSVLGGQVLRPIVTSLSEVLRLSMGSQATALWVSSFRSLSSWQAASLSQRLPVAPSTPRPLCASRIEGQPHAHRIPRPGGAVFLNRKIARSSVGCDSGIERRRSIESREQRVSPIRWRSEGRQTRARVSDDGRTTGTTAHSDRTALDRPSRTPSSLLAVPASSVMRIDFRATACRSSRSLAVTLRSEYMTAGLASAGSAQDGLMLQVCGRPTSLVRV